MKIGLIYVEGALPAFENFGGLPTHLVKQNGIINGDKAHKVLDGLIIPGGSIIESQSIRKDLKREIKKMDSHGSFILGICSGFQILANKTDIGRKSPCPMEKEGLGLLDVSFHPLISNDRVEAEVVGDSFLTTGMIGQRITGFHCHTYGEIKGDAPPIFLSQIKRTDYTDNPRKILSGVRNDDGNVVGTLIHGSLDENLGLVQNILNYLDTDEKDVLNILDANQKLKRKIKNEIGVGTNILVNSLSNTPKVQKSLKRYGKSPLEIPKTVMIASTSSESGKTFLTTGIVGALRKKGYKACILKVGPDIRDIVPPLYLNKEKIEKFSSIKIGELGWKDLEHVINSVEKRNYDIIIIEGVMSVFTGMLNQKIPFSSAEIAKAGNIPVILISACNKGGIETAAVDIVGHIQIMDRMGIKTGGVILNKVYDKDIAQDASSYIRQQTGLEFIAQVPKIKITDRGNIPEVEIRLEDFCLTATKTVETYLDINEIEKIADRPKFTGYLSHKELLNAFG